jgi:protein-L-isoaspartate(D-aspartate) O-methyltransferase
MMRMAAFMVRLVLAAFLVVPSVASCADHAADRARAAMVRTIQNEVRATGDRLGFKALSPAVVAAMGQVPRHEFVPDGYRDRAYANRPLPIGYGQTISQPYIVAIMTELVHPTPRSRVLEVGTGSGYQAAVLAEIVDKVYTMEIIEPLGRQARKRLKRLGYDNVEVKVGDGYYGWPEHGPYDAIVVTAAASHIPPPLVRQLKPGGRMIIPVGSSFMVQQLVMVEKDKQGEITTRQLLPVSFVPLTGGH